MISATRHGTPPSLAQPQPPHSFFVKAAPWLPWVIVAAVFLVYANSFSGVLLFDDSRYLLENPRIRQLWPLDVVFSGRRPVLDFTLAVNYAVSGGLDSLFSFHFTNILIHLLAALALYGVVRRSLLLLTKTKPQFSAAYGALIVALLWAVHPLQTQSVTYIIQRSESLMGLFYLLVIYCFIRGVQSLFSFAWYAVAVAGCAMGMGAKGVCVTAPVVVLLFDRTFLSHSFSETVRRRWGLYLALAATWSVLVWTDVAPGVLSSDRSRATVGFSFQEITPIQYALTQFGVLLHYLRIAIWPKPLCLDYGWPVAGRMVDILGPGLVILVLLGVTVWLCVHRPQWGFLGLWFFLILAPTSSIVPIRDPAFEHRMYLPLAAVLTAVVLGVHSIGTLIRCRIALAASACNACILLIGCAAASALGVGTVARNRDYHSKLGMWSKVVALRPHHGRACDSLGAELFRQGRVHEAVAAHRRSIQLEPRRAGAYYNLGVALGALGQIDESAEMFTRALDIDPYHADAAVNLGASLVRLGRHDEALSLLQRAAQAQPDAADIRQNLGALFLAMEQYDDAIQELQQAVHLDENLAQAYVALGLAYAAKGQWESARNAYERALQHIPNDPTVRFRYAEALKEMGRKTEALREYQHTLRLDPDHQAARLAIQKLHKSE